MNELPKNEKKINRKKLTALIVISVTILLLTSVTVLPIVDTTVSKKRANELYDQRAKVVSVFHVDLVYENNTAICGCNYTTAILEIHLGLSNNDNNSYYSLEISNEQNHTLSISAGFFHENVYYFRLNSTYENGKDFDRCWFFNNWTEQFTVSLIERYEVLVTVISNRLFSFENERFLTTFTIATGMDIM